jgi:opacity protein-like surface antigen
MKAIACAFLGWSVIPLVTFAQQQGAERPLQWHVNAGFSKTHGQTSDYLRDGFVFGFGASWRPGNAGPFALTADLGYSHYEATRALLDQGSAATQTQIDDGNGQIVGLDIGGVYEIPLGQRARGYVTAGVGEYYRRIELTQTVLFSGTLCDFWWGVCFPGVVANDLVVSKESTTRFGWNGGLGVDFPLSNGQSWFIDARFHRIETTRPTQFIPIQIGYRF